MAARRAGQLGGFQVEVSFSLTPSCGSCLLSLPSSGLVLASIPTGGHRGDDMHPENT